MAKTAHCRRIMLLASTTLVALVPHAALAAAQGSAPISAQATAASPRIDDTSSTEIIVTAQKREQSLNNVGLTVTALTGDTLKSRQIVSLQDLSQAVPSLTFANAPTGAPVVSLRGVGYYDQSLAAYPAVSLYLDEVLFPFPALASHANFDLQRVEVLKGPQGILFGANATGGAINFIAAKPTDRLHAGVEVSYGRFNAITEEGFVSGPLSSTLSARLSQRVEFADGWQRSVTRPGDRNGKVENYMGRAQLDFHPSEGVKFLLNVNGWQDKTEPQAAQFVGKNIQIPGFENPELAALAFHPHTPQAADWNPGLPRRNNKLWQVSLRSDIALGGDISLTTLTAYTKFKQRQAEDFDGVPIGVDDFPADNGDVKSFFQEVRFANGSRNHFRWIVGANLQRDKVSQEFHYLYEKASTNGYLGITDNWFGIDQKMRHVAGFGNAEFDVSNQITLKAGARYTASRLSTRNCGTDLSPPYIVGHLFYDYIVGGRAGPYTPGLCYALNNLTNSAGAPITVNGVAPGLPGAFAASTKEHNLSYKAGVDFKPAEHTLLYANITKGYKSGNYPTIGAALFTQYLFIKQESVLAYEAGFKLGLLDRKLQLNGAVFYYDYKNKQLRSRTLDPIFGLLDAVQNIPKSHVTGGELEMVARPTRELTLSANGTYIKGRIDEFSGLNAAGVNTNFRGTDMPYTPKWQLNGDVDYTVPLSASLNLVAGAAVTYRSRTSAIIGGNLARQFDIKSYTLVDARLGVRGANWRAMLWGKNIFNEYYYNNVSPAFDTLTRYTGKPATYGVTLGYNF